MKELFTRSKLNPILEPLSIHDWESGQVYNPGAIYHQGRYHLFYRAVGKNHDWHSSIGYAVSRDGVHFKRFSEPLLPPQGAREKRGPEDPRITKIGRKFFLVYAAYDGQTPRLSLAVSLDLQNWHRQGGMLKNWNFSLAGGEFIFFKNGQPRTIPQKREWSKSGALFPEKISGKYWFFFGEYRIWLASSVDGKNWHVRKRPFLGPRDNTYFDNCYVEMGPPPIKTKRGWLVIYHGISCDMYYRLGLLLLDLHNPAKILFRSQKAIFGPKKSYEMSGLVDIIVGKKSQREMTKKELNKYLAKQKKQKNMPHVTFCCGTVKKGDKLRIYYGAGDGVICTAIGSIAKILSICR